MSKSTVFVCLASLLLVPMAGLADEIEPNFMAGYRMGFFMAVAAGNPDKNCGNMSFASMAPVVREYVSSHAPDYPLKYSEVLDLQEKYFPCPKKPAASEEETPGRKKKSRDATSTSPRKKAVLD